MPESKLSFWKKGFKDPSKKGFEFECFFSNKKQKEAA